MGASFGQIGFLIKIILIVKLCAWAFGCAAVPPTLPPAPVLPAAQIETAVTEPAFVEPSPKSRLGGLMEYAHDPAREYAIYARRGGLTPVVLTPGSRIGGVSIANPDGWRIDDRQSYGSGRTLTPVLNVSPGAGARVTEALVTTQATNGLFMLKLIPHGTGFAQVKFRKSSPAPAVMASVPDISRSGAPYRLTGERAPWQPVSVRDDGSRTYVQLQAGSGAWGMPAVMAIGPDGETLPVNARRQGDVLVVDGLHLGGLRLSLGGQTIEARR